MVITFDDTLVLASRSRIIAFSCFSVVSEYQFTLPFEPYRITRTRFYGRGRALKTDQFFFEKRHLRSVVDAISGADVARSDDDVPNIVEMRRLKTIASRGRTHDDDNIPDIVEMRDPVS